MRRIELVVACALSILFFFISGLVPINIIMMLIPLQILLIRRGKSSFLLALGMAFGVIVAIIYFTGASPSAAGPEIDWTLHSSLQRGAAALKGAVILFLAALLAGFLFFNLYQDAKFSGLVKALVATAGSVLLALLYFLYIRNNPGLMDDIGLFIDEQISALFSRINLTVLAETKDMILAISAEDKIWSMLVTTFSFFYFITLVPGWWLGSLLAARISRLPVMPAGFQDFRVPAGFGWALLGILGFLFLQSFFSGYFWTMLSMNILMVLFIIFGTQGVSVIRFLLQRSNLPRGLVKFLPFILFGVMLLVPAFFTFCLIIIPGIGISEIWFKFRGPFNPVKKEEPPPAGW